MSRLRIPSSVSAVPESENVLRFMSRVGKEIGSVSDTSLGDLVRLDLGPHIVARGDVLSPGFRRGLALDARLCYSTERADRVAVLRLLNDMAAAWDAHRRSAATWNGAR